MICKASTLPRVTEGLTYKKVTKEKSHPSAWLFIYDDIKKLICTCRDSYPAPYTEAVLNLLVKSPTRGVGFRIITYNQLKVTKSYIWMLQSITKSLISPFVTAST